MNYHKCFDVVWIDFWGHGDVFDERWEWMKRDVIVCEGWLWNEDPCVVVESGRVMMLNEMSVWMKMIVLFHTQSHSAFQTTHKCLYSSNITVWTHQGNVVSILSTSTQTSSQIIILVSIVVMCFNIDSSSFVLLFMWIINNIHWCTNTLCCYHCSSHKHTHSTQSWTMTEW